MHNHDDKYPARSGFKPGIYWLHDSVDTKEPLGLAISVLRMVIYMIDVVQGN